MNVKGKMPSEIIRVLRLEVLIHCCLYYWLDRPIMRNWRYDEIADQLKAYQEAFPDDCDVEYFDEEFKDFNPSDAIGLPYDDHTIITQANMLLHSLNSPY